MRSNFASIAAAALGASQLAGAFDLNVNDASSVKSAASGIAKNLWSYYKGTTDQSQLGLLPKPYYWWEAGAMFGTYITYSEMTGDKQYNQDVANAIYSQASPTDDFMMLKTQSFDLGNDDQGFWALTAMSAAEHKLPAPSGQSDDIWLKLASGAFNDLIGRWNTSFCGGGLKWQFLVANNGFDYKSSIANAATMQLGARLALFTGNQTYADKAGMIYDWMQAVGFISNSFQVFDGAGDDPDNCTKIDPHEWSYNSASLIGATAAMANYTASKGSSDAKMWSDRVSGLWQHASQNFFKNGVLYEQACEDVNTCDVDQWSFKAYMARWASFAGQVVPSIMDDVQSKLQSTANALVKACNSDNACGTKWYDGSYNSNTGVGQQMSALEVISNLLAPSVPFVPGSGSQSIGGGGGNSSSSATSSAASTTSSASSPSSSAPNAAATATSAATASTSATPSSASVASALPTTMATVTVSPVASAANEVVPASSAAPSADSSATATASSSSGQQGGSSSSGASSGGSSGSQPASGSGSPKPVLIGADGIPYCTEAA